MTGFDEKSALTAELSSDAILARARLLSKAVTAIYDDNLRPFGISAMQFALLRTISRAPITRTEIARLRHLHKSTLTRDLVSVLSAGWIEEVREGADGRCRPIALTHAGKELMLDAQHAWLAAQDQAEALLGKDGMDALMSVTDRLLGRRDPICNIKTAAADPPIC